MKSIERHPISPTIVNERRIKSSKEEIIPTIKASLLVASEHVLGTSLDVLREVAIREICAGYPNDAVIRDLRFYETIALSNFRHGAGKERFIVQIDGEEIHFTPQRKTAFMSVDHWEDAYDACLLMRDMAGLKFLANVPEEVFAESNNGTTPHDLSYYRFLAHFFNGGKDTGKLLINAFEEAMKPQSNPGRTKFVELVRIPILDLMQAIVEGDNAKFNDYLVAALEGHKKYFGTKDNAFATPGWLSMRILATCAMAVDANGFTIDVESDYIPRWLYMGEGIK
ncbi:MAG: hypothetical protein RLZZ519_1842 [Bacteroidota bacterium]|jgi:hypothetical protein